jgi:hypothetical protein
MGPRGVGRGWAKRGRDQHLLPKTTPLMGETKENCRVRWTQDPGSSECSYRHFSIVEPLSRVVDSPFKPIQYIHAQFVILLVVCGSARCSTERKPRLGNVLFVVVLAEISTRPLNSEQSTYVNCRRHNAFVEHGY